MKRPPADYLLRDTIRIGTVVETDLPAAAVRVRVGDIETHWIGWNAIRAGNLRIWSPPSDGEQVILCLPDGEWEAAFILGALFSEARPAPADDGSTLLQFDDGAQMRYDMDAHVLTIDLSAANGRVMAKAPQGMDIEADLRITGDIALDGTLTGTEDVIASDISLTKHKHEKVAAGQAVSGGPL